MYHVQPEGEMPHFVDNKIKTCCEEDKVVELHLKLNRDEKCGADEFIESPPTVKDLMEVLVKKEFSSCSKESSDNKWETRTFEMIKVESIDRNLNRDEKIGADEFIESAPTVEDQKEELVKKEFNSCLKASSDNKWETKTFEMIKVESIDRIIDEKLDCEVTVPIVVKNETNDINVVTAKELLNYCHENPFKSEALEQDELHIKQEEDNENRLNEKYINKEFDNDVMLVRESGTIKKETNTNTKNEAADKLTRKSGNRLVLHQCPECPYIARKKYHLKRHYSIKHKKSDEIDWYSCRKCPYKTCQKEKLKSHGEIHNIHQCPDCPYKTCRKTNLKRHAETHKKWISKCSKPSDETVKPISLKKHQSERKTIVQRLHCSECSFKTHQPGLLQRHILAHKGDAFKCPSCPYLTERKDLLAIHQVKHESIDKWYSCPLCPFKTYAKKIIQAHCLRRHSIDPKNPKQVVVFKCNECTYENGFKRNVITHQLIHNQSGWFQCPDCAYKTPHRSNFKKHRLRHQGENAEGWHKCLECPYKTASNYDLQKHVIKHKSAGEIRWFECSQCSFKTAHKDSLTRHELRHKDAQEVEWFCCYECPFKTRHKLSLVGHLSKHKKRIDNSWLRKSANK